MRGLFEEFNYNVLEFDDWKISNFSANDFYTSTERKSLEDKNFPLIEVTDDFNRKSVSFQLSKKESLHRWLKYKEAFSAELVNKFLREFNCKKGDLILDPFMGSGTTALAAVLNDMNSIGYDILPMSKISIIAKHSVLKYDLQELKAMISFLGSLSIPSEFKKCTNELSTTKDAYPANNGVEIEFYTEVINDSHFSDLAKNLFTLCVLNTLERVSYSAKDGQYLRWDYRCPKIIEAEKARLEAGKKPFAVRLNKGEIPSFNEAVLDELCNVVRDIENIQYSSKCTFTARTEFVEGSALFNLPLLADQTVAGVISSPPYCNRYDYTRTYALELAYLGKTDNDVKQLRQDLLSCTVENKPKRETIKEFYNKIGRQADFVKIETMKLSKLFTEKDL